MSSIFVTDFVIYEFIEKHKIVTHIKHPQTTRITILELS